MRCLNVYLGTLLVTVLISCGDPQPVSTGTRTPGLSPIGAAPATSPTTTTTTGDATKGQTALTASCNGCHGKSAHALAKADVASIDAAGAKSYHAGAKTTFTASAADIKAYLATQ